jgi:hypothetical protein
MPLLLLKQPGLGSLFDSTVGTQREIHRAKLQSLAQHPKKIESGHYCYLAIKAKNVSVTLKRQDCYSCKRRSTTPTPDVKEFGHWKTILEVVTAL